MSSGVDSTAMANRGLLSHVSAGRSQLGVDRPNGQKEPFENAMFIVLVKMPQ